MAGTGATDVPLKSCFLHGPAPLGQLHRSLPGLCEGPSLLPTSVPMSPPCQHLYSSHLDQFSSVQSLSHVQLFVTPGTAARQASLSITNSQSLLKLMPIESVMSSNHLTLCHPLLLLPSIFPSIRVFLNGHH